MKSKFIALCLISAGFLGSVSAQVNPSNTKLNLAEGYNLSELTSYRISFKNTESSPTITGSIGYDNFGNMTIGNNGTLILLPKTGTATFQKAVSFDEAATFKKAVSFNSGLTSTGVLYVNNPSTVNDWTVGMEVYTHNNLNQAIVVHTPDNKLAFRVMANGIVNTKMIYAEAIQVRNDAMGLAWYDHVFNADYDLMPLSEVEKFVATNKHLPTIPTQADVNRDGINLAEMDGLLLKKVEELTLYIIDQQKQIQELQMAVNKK